MRDKPRRSEICLAELLTALHELDWKTEDQAKAIFHALGFNWKNSKPAPIEKHQQKEVFDRIRYRAKPLAATRTLKDASTFSAPPIPELPVELPKNILNGKLKSLGIKQDQNQTPPGWLNEEGFAVLKNTPQSKKPALESLFPTLTQRGIISAALTVKKTGQDIDIQSLISQVIKCHIPKSLPRTIHGTLENGCQLLLDYSDSMTPFWEDLSALAGQIENLVGPERITVFEFEQDPSTAEYWTPSAQPKGWKPETNRPILVATDLNIIGTGRRPIITPEWQSFIGQCEQLHIPLMLLIPWRESFWPDDLGNHPLLIHWNPATTAAMAYSLVGKGHEISR